jgi:hypothetical protein
MSIQHVIWRDPRIFGPPPRSKWSKVVRSAKWSKSEPKVAQSSPKWLIKSQIQELQELRMLCNATCKSVNKNAPYGKNDHDNDNDIVYGIDVEWRL